MWDLGADKIRKSEQGTGIAQIQRPECTAYVGSMWVNCSGSGVLCEEW